MESKSEFYQATNGATVEVGTIVGPTGKEFSAMGSVVDLSQGAIFGYVKRDPSGALYLATWDGDCMFVLLRVTGTWKKWTRWGCTTYTAYQATINGMVWSGRHGDSDLLRLRRGKSNV